MSLLVVMTRDVLVARIYSFVWLRVSVNRAANKVRRKPRRHTTCPLPQYDRLTTRGGSHEENGTSPNAHVRYHMGPSIDDIRL
jgi:hypothetical protein